MLPRLQPVPPDRHRFVKKRIAWAAPNTGTAHFFGASVCKWGLAVASLCRVGWPNEPATAIIRPVPRCAGKLKKLSCVWTRLGAAIVGQELAAMLRTLLAPRRNFVPLGRCPKSLGTAWGVDRSSEHSLSRRSSLGECGNSRLFVGTVDLRRRTRPSAVLRLCSKDQRGQGANGRIGRVPTQWRLSRSTGVEMMD